MASMLPESLDRLAQIQRGVLSLGQLLDGGLSKDVARWQVKAGRWRPLHLGVYATFTGPPSRDAAMWAAVLRAGRGAVLSHYSAAELHGLMASPRPTIHVTIPSSRRIGGIRGVAVHVSRRIESAVHPTLLPPRTTVEETVLDLTQVARSAEEACGWIVHGIGRKLTTRQRLRAALERRRHVSFRGEIAEVLSDDWAGVHSLLEYRYVRRVELPHALPRGRHQVRAVRNGRTEYRDVLYDGYHLAVELDGRSAHPGDTRWNDIRRDNAAAADGVRTLRYGWDDLRVRPCQVAAEVVKALAQAGHVRARPCSPGCPVRPSD